MAKKAGQRVQIKMRSSESPFVYFTFKSKRNTTERLQLKKYDPNVQKHVIFKEER